MRWTPFPRGGRRSRLSFVGATAITLSVRRWEVHLLDKGAVTRLIKERVLKPTPRDFGERGAPDTRREAVTR